MQLRPRIMRVLIQMINTSGVEGARASDDAVDCVAFRDQQFRKVGSVLACDPCYERFFHGSSEPQRMPWCHRKKQLSVRASASGSIERTYFPGRGAGRFESPSVRHRRRLPKTDIIPDRYADRLFEG